MQAAIVGAARSRQCSRSAMAALVVVVVVVVVMYMPLPLKGSILMALWTAQAVQFKHIQQTTLTASAQGARQADDAAVDLVRAQGSKAQQPATARRRRRVQPAQARQHDACLRRQA